MTISKLVFLLGFLALISVHSRAQQGKTFAIGGRVLTADALTDSLRQLMAGADVSGMSIAVIDHNNIVYSNGLGERGTVPDSAVNRETIFEAASLSKSFLVFVANKLIDEGKLDLDKPLYEYLPYPPLEHDARYKRITARMILSHSSGIENWMRENNPDTLDIVSDPGTTYVYSGEGFQYLARVIARILHKPYAVYVRELVLQPLGLERTYAFYSKDGKSPSNYAMGHGNFGQVFGKWKNDTAVPASGMNLTALDYARLITAFFDGRHFSENRIREMIRPVVPLMPGDKYLFFGLGFAIQYSPHDTIIFHNGFNSGFKSVFWYSVVNKRGVVMLTNSEREDVIEQRVSDLTVRFDLAHYFDMNEEVEQYPSNACVLLKIYKQQGVDAMYKKIKELKDRGALGVKTLEELGDIFSDGHSGIADTLLTENLALYPGSSENYYLLGQLDMRNNNYKDAYLRLTKAREMHCLEDGLDLDIARCRKMADPKQ